jgi:glycosyltransferase involved in cell wall biosynthesis
MKVVFFQRKPHPFHFSIEKIFQGVKEHHPQQVQVETAELPFVSQGFLPRFKGVLWSRKRQGDINHITGDVHFLALGLKKRKTILTIHDLNFLNHPNALARFVLKMFWLTLPLKRVALVTVISSATKKDLLSRTTFPEERIRLIPNFYEPSLKPVLSKFNADKPRILQVGTKANKNILRLLDALKGVSCHLAIIGEQNNAIVQKLKTNEIEYTWYERLSEEALFEEYRKCDLLTFISTIEGFGMPILEAQAVGRPVITSNISSMPEVAGAGACLVDPYDVQAIKNGIIRIMEDEPYRQQLIEHGFQNLNKFEVKNVSKMYYDLHQELFIKNKSL